MSQDTSRIYATSTPVHTPPLTRYYDFIDCIMLIGIPLFAVFAISASLLSMNANAVGIIAGAIGLVVIISGNFAWIVTKPAKEIWPHLTTIQRARRIMQFSNS